MRHLNSGNRLSITTSHRKAMMRNLVTSLLEHGKIKTTLPKAKAMRKDFDKMIGLAKRGDLHARRQALSFVKCKQVVKKLFEKYGPLYQERNGGYTRIYRLGHRLGDNAQLAIIEMVEVDSIESGKQESSTEETLEEVKQELETDQKTEEVKPNLEASSQEEGNSEIKNKKERASSESKKEG